MSNIVRKRNASQAYSARPYARPSAHDPHGSNGLLFEADFGEAISPRQEPPFADTRSAFVPGSVGPGGQSIQLLDKRGEAHTLSLADALLAVEARRAAERFGDVEINTIRFEQTSRSDAGGGSRTA